MKKGQTFSLDLLIGLTVFLIIFISIFGFVTYISQESVPSKLKEESETILSSIEAQNSPVGFIENNLINPDKLNTIAHPDSYERMKGVIGTKYNFCIYFEDETGHILNFNGDIADTESDQVGIGDKSLDDEYNLKINGVPCGEQGIPP